MGQVIPRQHPAVVLRSQYKAVVALLCVAVVAIVALATAVVIVANDDDAPSIAAQPNAKQQILPPGTRFDGGPDEGTRGIQPQTLPPGTRFDGGPDEGTRGPTSYWETGDPRTAPAVRRRTRSGPARYRATRPLTRTLRSRARRARTPRQRHPVPAATTGPPFGGPFRRGPLSPASSLRHGRLRGLTPFRLPAALTVRFQDGEPCVARITV